MPKRDSSAEKRPGSRGTGAGSITYRYVKAAFILLLALAMAGAAFTGYRLGVQENVQATVQIRSDNALSQHLAEQKSLCEAVEKINLEQKLEQERSLNEILNQSIDAQQSAIEQQKEAMLQQKEEMDQLEQRILSSLMANFSDQLISRSNGSVDSYVEETESLLDLSRRLNKFSQSEDAAEIDLTEYRQALENRLLRIPTLRPASGRISSGFGYRIHPVYKHRHFHSGIDIVASRGTGIKAAATGYVSEAGYNRSMGYYIKISHGNGFTTVYMHCQKLNVSRGQTVTKGQTIATVGSTGTSTGPHLHYEVHIHGTPVNPSRFIME